MDTNEERYFSIGRYVLRGIGISLITLIIKLCSSLLTMAIYSGTRGDFSFIPRWAVNLIIFIGMLLIYGSVTRMFTLYDKDKMRELLRMKLKKVTMRVNMPKILASPEFLIETASCTLFAVIASFFGAYYEIPGVFRDTGAPEWLLTLLPTFVLIPSFFIVSAWQRYEVCRRWHWLDHIGNISSLDSVPRLIFNGILIFCAYVLIYPIGPILIIAYLSVFGIFGAFFDGMTVIGTIAVIASVFLLIFLFTMLHAVRTRKKLLKKLRKVCAGSGYELSAISRPYASLFKPVGECNFTLKKDGKTYSCRFIGSYLHRAPMYFVSNKHAFYLHRFGTKNHHFDIMREFEYNFEGEGEKIIILNPVPKSAYATVSTYVDHSWYDEDKLASVMTIKDKKVRDGARKLEPGDKIWGYGIYNTTSFIGAIDRACLGRYNGLFD